MAEPVSAQAVMQIAHWLPWVLSLNPWLFFALMLVAAAVAAQAVVLLLRLLTKLVTARTKTNIDDIIIRNVHQPVAWVIFSALLYVAVAPLPLANGLAVFVNEVLLTANILALGFLAHRVVRAVFTIWRQEFATRTETTLDDTMLPILSKFSIVTVWAVAAIIALGAWGVQIGPFLAGLGIAGLAVGLALQGTLSNIFGGVSLAFDHAYKVGDKVKLADGTVGVVHDISLRSTQVRTYDGDLVMVPNGKIAADNIYTYAQPAKQSRGSVEFGVVYGADVEKVKKLVLKTLKGIEKVLDDPEPAVWFIDMGAYALNMRAYFWLADYNDVWVTEREATGRIYEALNKAGIGIPFPTQTVHVKK